MPYDSIPRRLQNQAKQNPQVPAFFSKSPGHGYVPTSYAEYGDVVKRASKSMLALGIDKNAGVCILGFNRAEWIILDVAAMSIGAVPAGIYTTCSPDEIRYILHHAEAMLVLVENTMQFEKVQKARKAADGSDALPMLKSIVLMKGASVPDDPIAMSWEQFLAKGTDVADSEFFSRLDALEPGGLATLIYTSGTTGPPKGVMLSHENLAWTVQAGVAMNSIGTSDRMLSYLPLSHIAEQMFSIHIPITAGAQVYFAESIENMGENLKEVRPTLFFGVPRVWEKFYAVVSQKLSLATGAKKRILDFAMGVGAKMSDLKCRGEMPGMSLALQYEIANRLVFKKLKEAMGLDQARILVTAAAPISKELLEFFAKLDLLIREVYGQSEDCGPTTSNRAGMTKLGTVGPAYPGVSVKIAEDGEILVKGPNVFMGYYKDPAATAEVLQDGWLYSGDLGQFDSEGYLNITGRKKEIIITAGGKNIAPKNIEMALKANPLIGEAVVIGDRQKYLTVLIALEPEKSKQFAAQHGFSGPAHECPALLPVIQKTIDEVNETLARVEQVKKFCFVPRPFSIDAGELTPTLKLKRSKVAKNFAAEIEAMYKE